MEPFGVGVDVVLDYLWGPSAERLLIAAASFVYIALSDLLPEMMRRKPLSHSVPEVLLVLLGVAFAGLIRALFGSR